LKISVIIPVKNGERTISRCLEAIFSQTYKPYEVIVVDGRSTDKTVEKAKLFPVKVVYEDYGTVGGARQVGLENARGDYVAFTDADCIPERNWLENLVRGFEVDNGVLGVGGGIKNVGEGIWEKSITFIMDTFLGSANSVQGRLFKVKKFVRSISGCNSMYRRKVLLKVGGVNVTLSVNEDTELNRRLLKVGKLLYVPNAIVLHYQGRGLRGFAKRMYQFGFGRGKLRLWDLQCIPPVATLILMILSLIFTHWIFLGAIIAYSLVLTVMGLKIAIRKKDFRYAVSIPIVYFIEHSLYTIGFWLGLITHPSKLREQKGKVI